MERFLVLCILFLAAVSAEESLNYRDDVDFLRWSSMHLEAGRDLATIYPVWKRNAEFVRAQNSQKLPYTVSMNKFGHLSVKQLLRGSTTFKEDANLKQAAASELNDVTSIPPSVDWRKKGVVPPVCNQGQCGSSVGFGLVEAIDCFHAIETGNLVLASVDEFVDCCTTNGTCNGIPYDPVGEFKCVAEIGGLAGENYHSPNGSCLKNMFPPVVKIHGGKEVPHANETALAAAVAMQPVVTAIDASHSSFQFYSGGIYDEPSCSSTLLDQAVLIVGYGSEDGHDYWIVQNSWGTDWGMEGYILMSRNKNNQCGIATMAAYPY